MLDLTKNTLIEFKEPVFVGNYPNGKFSHMREIKGLIINDSYGSKKGQHTFTILVKSCSDNSIGVGAKILRKGRTLYKDCKVLEYPNDHQLLADEKHERKQRNKDGIKATKEFYNQIGIKF